MSDTPRSDENPEFGDPTAPTDPTAPADHTAPIDTSATQAVPPVPPAPRAPGSEAPRTDASAPDASASDAPSSDAPSAAAGQGYGPPAGSAPQNPYATPPQAPGSAPQNPYASAPPPPASPYGQAPYGQASYGQAQYGQAQYGAPPAAYAAPSQLSGSTIALLIVGGLTTLGCGFGILGLIFGIIAAAKKDEPTESAKFTRWGWIAIIAGLVLSIIAVIAFFALIAVGGSTSFDSGY